ncbi:hypothetical protein M3Y99_01957400 [Aphelenchoides fujianensis]|nr:hypothetical protein M3Y99_01957400 [Aphelenchoides fujianensis]
MLVNIPLCLAFVLLLNSVSALIWWPNFSPQLMQMRLNAIVRRERARQMAEAMRLNDPRDVYEIVPAEWDRPEKEEDERTARPAEPTATHAPQVNVADAYRPPVVDLSLLLGKRSFGANFPSFPPFS